MSAFIPALPPLPAWPGQTPDPSTSTLETYLRRFAPEVRLMIYDYIFSEDDEEDSPKKKKSSPQYVPPKTFTTMLTMQQVLSSTLDLFYGGLKAPNLYKEMLNAYCSSPALSAKLLILAGPFELGGDSENPRNGIEFSDFRDFACQMPSAFLSTITKLRLAIPLRRNAPVADGSAANQVVVAPSGSDKTELRICGNGNTLRKVARLIQRKFPGLQHLEVLFLRGTNGGRYGKSSWLDGHDAYETAITFGALLRTPSIDAVDFYNLGSVRRSDTHFKALISTILHTEVDAVRGATKRVRASYTGSARGLKAIATRPASLPQLSQLQVSHLALEEMFLHVTALLPAQQVALITNGRGLAYSNVHSQDLYNLDTRLRAALWSSEG